MEKLICPAMSLHVRSINGAHVLSVDGLDLHSADGMDIPILDFHLGPISAAPGLVGWWSLQQSDLTQTSQLLTAAHDACFPATAIHC